MDKDIKKVLIYLCIIIVIIIILRFLYIRLKNQYVNYTNYTNYTIENFNTADSIDLLSKTKSNLIMTSNSSNFGVVTVIKPWTTKLYNIENNKTKAISLYQPNLLIHDTQYCKLGDILSINLDYSPPNSNQLSLFIKKSVYDNVGLFNLVFKIAADYEFMLRLFKMNTYKIKYLPLFNGNNKYLVYTLDDLIKRLDEIINII